MGSRKERLANEAIRRQQAAIERQNRIDERQAITPIVKDFLSACKEEFQAMSNEHAEKFKEYRLERRTEELARKKQALEEIKTRKAELNAHAKATQDLLKEFQTAHVEMSQALHQELTACVNNLRQETANLLDSFYSERKEAIPEQRKLLASFINILKAQEQERRKQAKEECTARREYLSELLDLDF